MCTAGQRVLLTITGPGPSFFDTKIYAGQRTRRGGCPIEQRGVISICPWGAGALKGDMGPGGGSGAWRGGRSLAISFIRSEGRKLPPVL